MADRSEHEPRCEQPSQPGECPNRIDNERTGEYGGPGDYGNQALWGHFANRKDWSHGNQWRWNWGRRRRDQAA